MIEKDGIQAFDKFFDYKWLFKRDSIKINIFFKW